MLSTTVVFSEFLGLNLPYKDKIIITIIIINKENDLLVNYFNIIIKDQVYFKKNLITS
jgi:hypothetical protein